MMHGLLPSQGITAQRKLVREKLREVDPEGAGGRWAQTVTRRVYTVQAPNSS